MVNGKKRKNKIIDWMVGSDSTSFHLTVKRKFARKYEFNIIGQVVSETKIFVEWGAERFRYEKIYYLGFFWVSVCLYRKNMKLPPPSWYPKQPNKVPPPPPPRPDSNTKPGLKLVR